MSKRGRIAGNNEVRSEGCDVYCFEPGWLDGGAVPAAREKEVGALLGVRDALMGSHWDEERWGLESGILSLGMLWS